MRKMFLLAFALLVSVFIGDIFAQENEPGVASSLVKETGDEHKLFFEIDAKGFFIDNEFKRHVAYGYTLPGMRVIPKFTYYMKDNLSLSLGASALRYWGANDYPYTTYSVVPEYSKDRQKGLHVLPYMRFDWKINDKLSFALGNIDDLNCHNLDIPLWNPERILSQDAEEGLQLKYRGTYWNNEVWLDWQNFNYKNDIDRESLLLGISGDVHTWLSLSDFLSLSYAFLWQHHGGELDTLTTLPLDHWTNSNIGINYMYVPKCKNIYGILFSFDYFYSKSLKNDTWFFNNGYAYFPKISMFGPRYEARLGFYESKDMISMYGSPFFSNLAQRNSSNYYPKNHLLYGKFSYNFIDKNDLVVNAYTELYYKFDSKTYLMEESKSLSFTLGFFISFDNRFFLTKIKSEKRPHLW